MARTRLFVAAAALALTTALLHPGVLGENRLAQLLFATLLPAGIALLAFTGEHGFTAAQLRKQFATAFGPLSLVALLCAGRTAQAIQLFSTSVIDPIYTDWTGLSQPALLMALAALAVAVFAAIRARRIAEAGLALFVAALIGLFSVRAGSNARAVWSLVSAVVLVLALIESAYELAFHDELTGLPTRRALLNAFKKLQAPYAIAVVDVDNFKSFNDEHGHDVGDQVLRMVAARLKAVKGGGVAYRSGGEEFTLVFPGAVTAEALPHVEAVRAAVEQTEFALRTLPRPRRKGETRRGQKRGSDDLQVTISVGLAAARARNSSPESVLKSADQAMYRAKREGRNRVMA